MNGLPLLLLATTVGMDFGWQPAVDNPNMLEYIIQLSPEEVQLLNSGKEELFSGIPQELKGRIDRVVIRMGREKLPQEPSLEKLRTMAAVGGNPSILNAGGSAGGTALAPPSVASGSPLATQGGLATIDPPRTLPSFGNVGTPAPPPPITYAGNYDVLGSGAYEDLLRQGTMPPNPLNINPSPASSTLPAVPVAQVGNNGGSGSVFPPSANNNSILPREGATLPAGGWNSASAGSVNPANTGNPAVTGNPAFAGNPSNMSNPPRGTGAPVGFNNNSVAGNTLGNNPSILPPGSGGSFNNPSASMASNPGNYNGAPTQYSQTGGANMGTGFNDASYGASANGGSGYGGTGFSGAGGMGQPNRIPNNGGTQFGTNPTLIASSNTGANSAGASPVGSGSGTGGSGASSSFEDDELSASADKAETAETSNALSASNWEKVLQILFILSVVLNFYLGVHLHKLLLRYRTLLSSVRASATVA